MFSKVNTEMSVEEFTEVLDFSQSTNASQCSIDSDTYLMSPDLFPPDEEETPHSSTTAERNNNSLNPGVLTLARRKQLAKLTPTRQSVPNITLYGDIIHTSNDQMFSLCTLSSLDRSKSASSLKLSDIASTNGICEHFVDHSGQKLVKTVLDLSGTRHNLTEFDLARSVVVNFPLKPTKPVEIDSLATRTALVDCVASTGPLETSLNTQLTSSHTRDTDLHHDTIPDNDRRSFLVDNIDIYKNIRRRQLSKYQLHDVPFQHVIITGVITSKSVARKSITQLEVDDGTAMVKCLFDELQCLPEHRHNFHTCLESWKYKQQLFKTDAVFDETFRFLREYAKRLFQETPQRDDLNTGDEVTIVGKVYDSKNEGRVIYHKYVWRKVNLASRENCGYGQNQFARPGRHF